MQLSVIAESQPDFTGDFYAILCVPKKARITAIKIAYRRLVSLYHPDKAVNIPVEEAKAKFGMIQKAYETLSDTKKREFYDQTGVTSVDPNTLEKNASSLVTGRLLDVCNSLCADTNMISPEQLARTDIVTNVFKSFMADLENNAKAQISITKVITKLDVVIKRLSRRNFKFEATEVGTMLLRQRVAAKAALGDARNAVTTLNRALVLLKDYKYKVEEVPKPTYGLDPSGHFGKPISQPNTSRFHLD